MFILISSLCSQEKWNQRLIKYYQNGYTIRSVNTLFIIMSNHLGPQYYFNVTPYNNNSNTYKIASTDTFEAYISNKQGDQDNKAIGKYYDWLITRHNSTTYKLLVPTLLLVIAYDYLPSFLKSFATFGILGLFFVAFARNLRRKSFIKNIVKPHNLKYNLDNKLFNKVYVIKSISPLNQESLNLVSECGKILKVKSQEGYHNYKLDSILERTEIKNILKQATQKIEVFSTVST